MTLIHDMIWIYIIGGIILTSVGIWLNWEMYFPSKKSIERPKYRSEKDENYYKEPKPVNTNMIYVLMSKRLG